MIPKNMIKHKHTHQKRTKRIKVLTVFLIIIMTFFILSACAKNSPSKSTVDGISDDVYEQIVQHYFARKTEVEMITGDDEELKEGTWIKEHELYEEAVEYAEDRENMQPRHVFPNTLLLDYSKNPDQYSKTESTYIEKLLDFTRAAQTLKMEEYEKIQQELVEELDIKESYNMFVETD